ncbi:MAG: hypothetical protein H8D63_01180 [Parcubacteria group bacterium]|nr:hypothetical protein [Parcubacteria group bacterium]
MRKVVVDYVQLRKIYDLFGSVFFGYVRAMNIAHLGWLYEEAQGLCASKKGDSQDGVNYPEEIHELENGGAAFAYYSRSGKTYAVGHSGENAYHDIEFYFPEDSSLAEEIEEIAGPSEEV